MVESVLQEITGIIIGNPMLAPVLILLAGVITSLTPCALASIPLVVGYMGMSVGMSEETWEKKKGVKITLVYILGQVVSFSILGAMAGVVGMLFMRYQRYWYLFLGLLMLLLSLDMAGKINIIKQVGLKRPTGGGYGGAFIMGLTSGIFMSPCATPVMVMILGVVSQTGELLKGVMYLIIYGLGMGFLVLLAGISTERVYKIMNSPSYERNSKRLQQMMSIIMLIVGLYFIYIGLV